jgi:hypothetical protein
MAFSSIGLLPFHAQSPDHFVSGRIRGIDRGGLFQPISSLTTGNKAVQLPDRPIHGLQVFTLTLVNFPGQSVEQVIQRPAQDGKGCAQVVGSPGWQIVPQGARFVKQMPGRMDT